MVLPLRRVFLYFKEYVLTLKTCVLDSEVPTQRGVSRKLQLNGPRFSGSFQKNGEGTSLTSLIWAQVQGHDRVLIGQGQRDSQAADGISTPPSEVLPLRLRISRFPGDSCGTAALGDAPLGGVTKRSAPGCFECRHFRLEDDIWPTCAAYPDGIEPRLYFGEFDHLKPLPGDRGIRWEQAEGIISWPPVLRVIHASG